MAYTREQILEEIRGIAKRLGQTHLTKREFSTHSEISIGSVRYHFGTWNKAIEEAGLDILPPGSGAKRANTLDDVDLLQDLLRLERIHGGLSESLVNVSGKYSIRPYRKRWPTLQHALHEAHALRQQGVIEIPEPEKAEAVNRQDDTANVVSVPAVTALNAGVHVPESRRISRKRSVVGEPIDFRGMRFAPVNEQGVVYLFGMVSQELGFLVESVRVKYPDCEGKRCCDAKQNLWEHIYIEFEFRSSNFSEHGHDPDECDIIVCWIHDWDECPIEVLELREAIRVLPRIGPTKH
ncbi:MAG: hypothetical protein GXX96_32510 [Planctomycetaceae bacterium]|nr:hypothetical protein [Planctomycetaceae bacterium]